MRVHLDTDFGGDPDDACALAMLLGWPDVELVGITTTTDRGGRRRWEPDTDWNVQWDTRATEIVAGAAADLMLATLPAPRQAHLRAADLPRLRASGPLGELLADQSEAHATELGMPQLGHLVW